MFSHASVCSHGGVVWGWYKRGVCLGGLPGGCLIRGGCLPGGGGVAQGVPAQGGVCLGGLPRGVPGVSRHPLSGKQTLLTRDDRCRGRYAS